MPHFVESDLRETANALEQRALTAYGDGDAAPEQEGPLMNVLRYVGLLREASGSSARYTFKLELADGRWDVAEQELPAVPRVGDVVRLADGEWKVHGTQVVRPRPRQKPPCEFFVCAPAGA